MTDRMKADATAPQQPVKPYTPTPQEVATAAAHLARRKARIKAPRLKVGDVKGTVAQVDPDHPDPAVWVVAIEQVFGTVDYQCADMLMAAALGTVWPDPETPGERAFNGILATLHGINPQDEVEAMLASQMVATHLAAMECLKRAQLREQTFQARDMNLRHATKLSRTYAAQVEALSRYRGKGQQKVTVEHVHVHSGGQAIVGAVTSGGRGAASKAEEQAHGPGESQAIAFEPGSPLQCPDSARDTVPIARCKGTGSL